MQGRVDDYTAPPKFAVKLNCRKFKYVVQDGRLYRTILDYSKINIIKYWVSNQDLYQTSNQRYM